jgi:LPXTG-motif cell wall-anchored protein
MPTPTDSGTCTPTTSSPLTPTPSPHPSGELADTGEHTSLLFGLPAALLLVGGGAIWRLRRNGRHS